MIFNDVAMAAARTVVDGFRKADSSHAGGPLVGRAADAGVSLPWLACMVAQARDGDHVDIGTLFGASALVVALTKKNLGHKGKVYCIDPYIPRQMVSYRQDIPEDDKEGTPEKLMRNAEALGVELTLIQKKSYPWPDELLNSRFSTAYIDGDHWSEAAYRDFRNVAMRTANYIGFDNYEEGFPDVQSAAHRVILTGDWRVFFKNASFIAFRRVVNDPERKIPPVLL